MFEQLVNGLEAIRGINCETVPRAWDGEWRVVYMLWNGQRLCTLSLKRPDRLPKLAGAVQEHGWVRGVVRVLRSDPLRVILPIADGFGAAILASGDVSAGTRKTIGDKLDRGNAFTTIEVSTEQAVQDLLTVCAVIERVSERKGRPRSP